MGLTDQSRDAVDDALDRLRDDYGELDVVEKTRELDGDAYRTVRERFEVGTVGGAGGWVRNGRGDALLVRRKGRDAWSHPGGEQNPGETLEGTARRGVKSESGVDCTIEGVQQAHVVRTSHVDDAEQPDIYRLTVVFEATYDGMRTRPKAGNVMTANWFDDLPHEIAYPEIAGFPPFDGDDASAHR